MVDWRRDDHLRGCGVLVLVETVHIASGKPLEGYFLCVFCGLLDHQMIGAYIISHVSASSLHTTGFGAVDLALAIFKKA